MKAAVDLHIHSALSPCADNDMTPNNIVNMAFLKGLDVIAVTDHNSVENIGAVISCAKKKGILAVPGMELETREEVHIVCLFPGLSEAVKMQEIVYCKLPDIKNREEIFGRQLVLDEEDNIIRTVDRLLLTAADIGIDEAFNIVKELNGVAIPAHIDRESYSVLSNLGLVPDCLGIRYLEVSRKCNVDKLISTRYELVGYNFIKSSDAHYLGDILERESFLELDRISASCLIETLREV
ncbi:MAG: PHP domain-containing protein [Clostridia bacterium]|nr:PHP domain-containing protein [Clostridia bacterium]